MAESPVEKPPSRRKLLFNWQELSGAFGDLGMFVPLSVLLAINCRMDLGVIFMLAGLMNVLTGLLFNQPVVVQPMKAIAAVAVAEGLTTGEIAAAGMIMGVVMLAAGLSGAAGWLGRHIPKAIVRGIQLGVGVKLALKAVESLFGITLDAGGFDLAGGLPVLGFDSILVAVIVTAILLVPGAKRLGGLAIVFVAGFGLLYLAEPAAYSTITFNWPAFAVVVPSGGEWLQGLLRGAIPQAPLTLLNSVIAVCALSCDYFPRQAISPKRMSMNVGLMNVLCVPFGGMPMCHGAGGLAAQYRFGARSGGSLVMLGAILVAAGLLFGSALLTVLDRYPTSILAVMLLFAGLGLATAARDELKGSGLVVVLATALPILVFNAAVGFAVGGFAALIVFLIKRMRGRRTIGDQD